MKSLCKPWIDLRIDLPILIHWKVQLKTKKKLGFAKKIMPSKKIQDPQIRTDPPQIWRSSSLFSSHRHLNVTGVTWGTSFRWHIYYWWKYKVTRATGIIPHVTRAKAQALNSDAPWGTYAGLKSSTASSIFHNAAAFLSFEEIVFNLKGKKNLRKAVCNYEASTLKDALLEDIVQFSILFFLIFVFVVTCQREWPSQWAHCNVTFVTCH